MQPLWLCPPRPLLLYFFEWAGLLSNNTAERNHWFPFALPWMKRCVSEGLISRWHIPISVTGFPICSGSWHLSPHHSSGKKYLSISFPLGWSHVAALGWYRQKRPQDGLFRTLQQMLRCTSLKWSERGSGEKWVRWNSKAKWNERKIIVFFLFLDFIHSEIRVSSYWWVGLNRRSTWSSLMLKLRQS